ncbi:MAG: hypothetical protein KAT43_05240 [Nanoarchaeota archaeon]|nr:hypothetical protein [Nanoarchaeota archaeon]
MFKKLAGTNKVQENITKVHAAIDMINSRLDGFDQKLAQTKDAMSTIIDQVANLESNKESSLYEFKKTMEEIKDLKQKLETNVNALVFLKDNIKKNLVSDLKTQVEKEVKAIHSETIRYFELKKDINESALLLKNFNQNIVKLNDISQEIKKADFELNKHFQNMKAADSEKLNLAREVDRLQGLIARERRRRN